VANQDMTDVVGVQVCLQPACLSAYLFDIPQAELAPAQGQPTP
jgi:hypothetical protein